RRGVARVSGGHAGRSPSGERVDLPGAQRRIILEAAHARVREPGGHGPCAGRLGDGGGVAARVSVGDERKGRDLAGPMAGLAMLLQNRQHVAVERRRLRRCRRPSHRRGGQRGQADSPPQRGAHWPLFAGFGSSKGASSRMSMGSPSRGVRSRPLDNGTPAVPPAAPAAPPRMSPPVPPKMPPRTAPVAASVPAFLPAPESGPFTVPSSLFTFWAAFPVAAVVALSEIGVRPGSVRVL